MSTPQIAELTTPERRLEAALSLTEAVMKAAGAARLALVGLPVAHRDAEGWAQARDRAAMLAALAYEAGKWEAARDGGSITAYSGQHMSGLLHGLTIARTIIENGGTPQ